MRKGYWEIYTVSENKEKSALRREFTKIFITFLLFGLGFIAGAVYMGFFSHRGYKETTAEITRFESKMSSDDAFTTYVSYVVDGKTYDNVDCGQYSSTYYVGKTIKIYYDPNDPGVIVADSIILEVIFLACGVLCLGIDVFFFVKVIVQKQGHLVSDAER